MAIDIPTSFKKYSSYFTKGEGVGTVKSALPLLPPPSILGKFE
jgi:hypothetical protein